MNKRVVFTSFNSMIVALAIMALTCIFLALPEQFASIQGIKCSGYEVLFNYKNIGGINYLNDNVGGRVSAVIFIILVLMVASAASLIFHKKDPTLTLIGGVLNAINGFLFLMMRIWLAVIYPSKAVSMNWVSYVSGALLLIIGGWLIYLGIREIINAKTEAIQKKAQSYNYLKNK